MKAKPPPGGISAVGIEQPLEALLCWGRCSSSPDRLTNWHQVLSFDWRSCREIAVPWHSPVLAQLHVALHPRFVLGGKGGREDPLQASQGCCLEMHQSEMSTMHHSGV